jgi:hypothetical protein
MNPFMGIVRSHLPDTYTAGKLCRVGLSKLWELGNNKLTDNKRN